MSCTKRIDEQSGCAITSALNIFAVPPTNVAILRSYFRELLPLNTIAESPYLFRIFSDSYWVDPNKIYIYFEMCLEKEEGGKWVLISPEDTLLAPIQSLGKNIVRQLKVAISNTEVYDSGTLYHYKNYLTDELSYPPDVKSSFLASTGYYPIEKHDSPTDEGFLRRVALFKDGKSAQFLSKLNFDLGSQDLYLLNNLDILFTVFKENDNFLLHCLRDDNATAYRINVQSVKLYVKMIELQPSLNLSIFSTLEKIPAKYAVRKTEIKSCFLTSGRTEIDHNIFNNVIPRRVTIGLVDSKAYNGNLKFSPFNFKPYDIRDITVFAGGAVFPTVPYKMNFTKQDCMRAYVDFYECLGIADSNKTNGITFSQFLDGWTIFTIPLTSTLDDTGGFELIKNGSTNIRLTFNKPIPSDGLIMIVLAEFDQLITIDVNRRVLSDNTTS